MFGEYDDEVAQAIEEHGPLAAYRRLIAANDAAWRSPQLDDGRALTRRRTAIHVGMARHWVVTQRAALGYDRPFALVALGGTGRGEMTPCSDTDFALLFTDAVEGNAFLNTLCVQTQRRGLFDATYGFAIRPQYYEPDHVSELEGMQLNSFIDMRAIFDPHDLAETFRRRIRETFDPFEHFLHVSRPWTGPGSAAAAGGCERLDRFDIKMQGLRAFLAGVWTLGGPQFSPSWAVYPSCDARDLEAYYFLLRIRGVIHLRRGTHREPGIDGAHVEDVLTFEDFQSFGELLGPDADARQRFEFANQVRARLLAARRRVERFARGHIAKKLLRGHRTSPGSAIMQGFGGLRYDAADIPVSLPDRSVAAMNLLAAAQKYGVAIESAELEGLFREAGDWLHMTPQLATLFKDSRGGVASSLEFLAKIDGVLERLFPGFARFEASLDERVLDERTALRSAWMRDKLRAFEECLRAGRRLEREGKSVWNPFRVSLNELVALESAQLDEDERAAVRLALVTKRLPRTDEDKGVQDDENLELHERFSSGFSDIDLKDYYRPYAQSGGFSERTVRLTEFLVEQRRAFKSISSRGRTDATSVDELVSWCGDARKLRALFVFGCVDRLMGVPASAVDSRASVEGATEPRKRSWHSQANNSARRFNTRELYIKAFSRFFPDRGTSQAKTFLAAGFGAREREILADFGEDFFSGQYGRHLVDLASHVVRLIEDSKTAPRVERSDNADSSLLVVVARDFRGLATCILGALYHAGVSLSQAHLFSANRYGLALDFFHPAPGQEWTGEVTRAVWEAVRDQRYISDADAEALPSLRGTSQLERSTGTEYCLRHYEPEDRPGILYSLTSKVFRYLRASIHGLAANTTPGDTEVMIHLTLPGDLSEEDARRIVAERFGPA